MKIANDQTEETSLNKYDNLKFDRSKTNSTKVFFEYHDNLEKSRLYCKRSVPVFNSENFSPFLCVTAHSSIKNDELVSLL